MCITISADELLLWNLVQWGGIEFEREIRSCQDLESAARGGPLRGLVVPGFNGAAVCSASSIGAKSYTKEVDETGDHTEISVVVTLFSNPCYRASPLLPPQRSG